MRTPLQRPGERVLLPNRLAGVPAPSRQLHPSYSKSIIESINKLILKDRSVKAGLAGSLFDFSPREQGYTIITDNANTLLALTAPYETATQLESPLTLPEYLVEVDLPC